jgi:hypothetical protein
MGRPSGPRGGPFGGPCDGAPAVPSMVCVARARARPAVALCLEARWGLWVAWWWRSDALQGTGGFRSAASHARSRRSLDLSAPKRDGHATTRTPLPIPLFLRLDNTLTVHGGLQTPTPSSCVAGACLARSRWSARASRCQPACCTHQQEHTCTMAPETLRSAVEEKKGAHVLHCYVPEGCRCELHCLLVASAPRTPSHSVLISAGARVSASPLDGNAHTPRFLRTPHTRCAGRAPRMTPSAARCTLRRAGTPSAWWHCLQVCVCVCVCVVECACAVVAHAAPHQLCPWPATPPPSADHDRAPHPTMLSPPWTSRACVLHPGRTPHPPAHTRLRHARAH